MFQNLIPKMRWVISVVLKNKNLQSALTCIIKYPKNCRDEIREDRVGNFFMMYVLINSKWLINRWLHINSSNFVSTQGVN